MTTLHSPYDYEFDFPTVCSPYGHPMATLCSPYAHPLENICCRYGELLNIYSIPIGRKQLVFLKVRWFPLKAAFQDTVANNMMLRSDLPWDLSEVFIQAFEIECLVCIVPIPWNFDRFITTKRIPAGRPDANRLVYYLGEHKLGFNDPPWRYDKDKMMLVLDRHVDFVGDLRDA